MFKTDLFKTSGHYDNYIENMYMLEIDEQEYGMKPMNCPSHAVMYSKSLHSYRELPIRYSDFGRLHRYELVWCDGGSYTSEVVLHRTMLTSSAARIKSLRKSTASSTC